MQEGRNRAEAEGKQDVSLHVEIDWRLNDTRKRNANQFKFSRFTTLVVPLPLLLAPGQYPPISSLLLISTSRTSA